MLSKVKISGDIFNTIHVAASFFILFLADFTLTSLQKILNVSIEQDRVNYHVDGYVTLGLTYVLYSICLLSAPSLISLIGPRIAMIIGTTMITTFFFLFTFENTWFTYLGVVMTGVGSSLLWVGQGNYLVLNSKTGDITVHISLFWAIFVTSMILGNLYSAIALVGKTRIDYETRQNLFHVVTVLGLVSVVVTLFLRPPKKSFHQPPKETPMQALKMTFSLCFSKDFFILLTTFCFMGFQQSFGWGVYHSTLGFTNNFGIIATQLVPIDAMVFGFGDLIGAAIHLTAPKLGYHWTRRYVFIVGYLLQMLAIAGIFCNIPDRAMFSYTNDSSFIQVPLIWLALLCSFILGAVDGFYNTQIYPLLANLSPDHSAQTVALFKLTKSMAAGIYFFICTAVGLRAQLVLLAVLGLLASICFSIVDKQVYKRSEERKIAPITNK